MKVYLDNCCFNRPFDDQRQARVRLEAEAKLEIQQRVLQGQVELVWSYIFEFENEANPFAERRDSIRRWKAHAVADVGESPDVLALAGRLVNDGFRTKDAIHLACAVQTGADYFVTTDDELLRKCYGMRQITVTNPVEFVVRVNQ